jgi:hypothetical protein
MQQCVKDILSVLLAKKIDQFISSDDEEWGRPYSLVALLLVAQLQVVLYSHSHSHSINYNNNNNNNNNTRPSYMYSGYRTSNL